MNRLRFGLVLVAGMAVGLLVASGTSVFARGGGDEVLCKRAGKKTVSCPKKELRGKRGKRGRRGPRGRTGPAGPAGAPGGAGSGLNLNFNAKLSPSATKEVTVGNFTIRASAQPSGNCENIKLLTTGGVASRVSIGPNGAFTGLAANSVADLQGGDTSNMFTAVSENGGSTVSGIVGRASVGGFCLISGYVTGA
jgi:hypothetical protein